MPTPVYSINVRGREVNGNHRCATQEEAQSIYDQLAKAVNAPEEFFEIELGTTKTTARKSSISGFSLSVHMEETPEERKARAIAQIESQMASQGEQCEAKMAYPLNTSGGLIGGY